jgi:hypothetical protein
MHASRIGARGGEPVPGPYDHLVKMVEEWKANFLKVKLG